MKKKNEQVCDSYMMEYAMEHWFTRPKTRKQAKYVYSLNQIEPLVQAGYLAFDREEKHEYPDKPQENWTALWYKPTAVGIKWWIAQRAAEYEKSEYVKTDPAVLEDLRFKGMGQEITLDNLGASNVGAVFSALRDGLLDFVRHRDYSGMPRSCDERITVTLTRQGMEFFDSLPRLVEAF